MMGSENGVPLSDADYAAHQVGNFIFGLKRYPADMYTSLHIGTRHLSGADSPPVIQERCVQTSRLF